MFADEVKFCIFAVAMLEVEIFLNNKVYIYFPFRVSSIITRIKTPFYW